MKNKKGHACSWRDRSGVDLRGVEGWCEYDQNTMYETLKALIHHLYEYTCMSLGFQHIQRMPLFLSKAWFSSHWLVLVCLITGLFNMRM